MKILMLSWNFAPVVGGLEDLVTHQFRRLRGLGHDVRIAVPHADVADEPGVARAPRPGFRAYARHAWRTARTWARDWRPDVILCGSATTLPIAWPLARRERIPLVAIAYGGELVHRNPAVRAGIRFALRRADRVVAISRRTRELAEAAGIDAARLSVVPPGVDPARAGAPPGRGDDAYEGRRVLLSVGRLVRRKGFAEFVEQVLPRVVASHPDVLYLVVGADATASLSHAERLRDALAARIEALGLSDHARLCGALDDAALAALYHRAQLFVLPVLDIPDDVEGFGIVFLEAALGHTASVATRVGGIPDAVEDGVTGLLVPPGDPEALAGAIRRLLDDGALREQLAANGERRAREQFAWSALAQRMADVLSSVAANAD